LTGLAGFTGYGKLWSKEKRKKSIEKDFNDAIK